VDSGYQKIIENTWSGNAATASISHEQKYGAGILYAEWPASVVQPVVELHSRVQTRDHAVDFAAQPAAVDKLTPQEHTLYTSPTKHMPLDGIVRDTMKSIVKGARTDREKAKASPKSVAAAWATSRPCSRAAIWAANAPT
jgi:hypothetical protein